MKLDTTINPREIAHYERLAETWWDTKGPFWPLHRLNELRIVYIRDQLCRHFELNSKSDKPLSGLHVLDVGCGGGILSESLARLGAHVTGIDVVDKNIRIASLHAQQQGLEINYAARTVDSLANTGTEFDVVLNMEVVEHVSDLPAFMASCSMMTRNGGVIFVATINRTSLSWLLAIVGAEYVLRWLPRGTHRWREFRKPEELEALLAKSDLKVKRMTGVAINPLARSFRLTEKLSVNYMLMAERGVT